jgi:hypothetical protein
LKHNEADLLSIQEFFSHKIQNTSFIFFLLISYKRTKWVLNPQTHAPPALLLQGEELPFELDLIGSEVKTLS